MNRIKLGAILLAPLIVVSCGKQKPHKNPVESEVQEREVFHKEFEGKLREKPKITKKAKDLDLALVTKAVYGRQKVSFDQKKDHPVYEESEAFRMGDILVLEPSEQIKAKMENKKKKSSFMAFLAGQIFLKKDKNRQESSVFSDARALMGQTTGTQLVNHHYIVSVDLSPEKICLEEMMREEGSNRPVSYIGEGPCSNTVKLIPGVAAVSKHIFKESPGYSSEYGQLYSLKEFKGVFGSLVTVNVIRCSKPEVYKKNSMCPKGITSSNAIAHKIN